MALTIGTQLGSHEITALLGKGGMGEVYRARDLKLKRDVAIKILPEEFSRDTYRVGRFQREAEVLASLNHPGIGSIYDLQETNGTLYLVLEFIEGETLADRIERWPIPVDETLRIGAEICEALESAHGKGIIHRDLKPANVKLTVGGRVKVLDFGLAKVNEARATNLSNSPTMMSASVPGMLLGTAAYMSPEQARGIKVDARTDIFSLGVVIYEMIAGCAPFAGGTMSDVLAAILRSTPAPLNNYSRQVPDELERIVAKALAKDRVERYQTISHVARDLKSLKQELEFRVRLEQSGHPPPSKEAGSTEAHHGRHTVGRQKERAELRAGFESAAGGRGLLFGVSGEPGIGKTTLVEDFLAELNASKRLCTIARGRCSERLAGTEAYLPILEALDSLLRGDKAEGIAQTMRRIAPTWYVQVAPLSSDNPSDARLMAEAKAGSQERMKRELGAFFQEITRARPIVLFFDDLHWADVSTTDLLAYLATKFHGLRLLIVATYRPSDLLLAKHPFLQIKPDLQARGVCHELALEFLPVAEIERYLALQFPRHCFPAELPRLILAKTEGSPLFMVDLVRYLQDRKVIAKDQGRWTLARSVPEIQRDLPESVRGMIERKIAQLGEEERTLLIAASVQGYEFDSAVVVKVLGIEPGEVEERLEKLERVHAFIRNIEENELPDRTLTLRYRFVHVLYQNALYGSLKPTRKAQLSMAVAQALLDSYGKQRGKIASELAALFGAARDFARAVEFYQLAARQAAEVYANAEAAALASRGLEMLTSLPDGPQRAPQELSLQVTRAMALSIAHGYAAQEAGKSYARARHLCQEMGEAPESLPVLFGLCIYYWIRGENNTARQIGEQMLRMSEKLRDAKMQTAAHTILGNVLVLIGELASAHEHLKRSIASYDAGQHQIYRSLLRLDPGVYSLAQSARVLSLLGYPDQARQRLQQAFTLSSQTGDPRSIAFTQILGTIVHTYLRECEQVRKLMEECTAHCTAHDIGDDSAWACAWGGWAVAELGQAAQGISLLQKNMATRRLMGAMISHTEFLTLLAQALGKAGRIEEGMAAVAEAMELATQTGEGHFRAEALRVKGELLLQTQSEGREVAAEACFQEALVIARQQSAKLWELRAATSLVPLWQKQGKPEEARALLGEIYGWFTEGFDTADMKDAKALLENLSQLSN
jgi:predicted ATPase